jgi:hypothetical protein
MRRASFLGDMRRRSRAKVGAEIVKRSGRERVLWRSANMLGERLAGMASWSRVERTDI